MRKTVPGELNGLLSPFLRRQRMKMVRPFFKEGQRILDVGCGLFCWQGMLPADCSYVGVDREQGVISQNQKVCGHKFLRMDIESGDWHGCGEGIELVIALAVIEHVRDPAGLLEAIWPQLADDGVIVLTTPHPLGNSVMGTGAALGLLSSDKEEHGTLLNRQAIERVAGMAGGEVIGYRRFLLGMNQLAVVRRQKKDGPTRK